MNGAPTKSSPVVSLQTEVHPDLEGRIERYKRSTYQRPIAEHTRQALTPILLELREQARPLILDLCCGVGESSSALAKKFPECFVLGVDKSALRISKYQPVAETGNARVLRADAIDTVLFLIEAGIRPEAVFLWYPNPWPKKAQLARRWHAHPIFAGILGWNCYLEVRTNWQLYAEECAAALRCYGYEAACCERFAPSAPSTPFERKYLSSGHTLWRIRHGQCPNDQCPIICGEGSAS